VWAIVKYVSCSNWYRYRINIGKGDIDPSLVCLVTVPVYSDATQLNSTSSWVELRRYRHPHRRNSTVADDRQCNWPSRTAYSQSARSRSVVFFPIILLTFFKFFTPKFRLPANSSKHVIYDVMIYKLSQLGHDVQNWSVTVMFTLWTCRQLDVELSCVAINGP